VTIAEVIYIIKYYRLKGGEPTMRKYIVFTADVQKEQTAKLRSAITDAVNSGTTEIYLAISSGGGNIMEGLGIAALIKALSIEVITHNIGQTDSVANVIFASGKKRYANGHASFMFHGVTLPINSNLTEHQLTEVHEQVKRLRGAVSNGFALYTGIPLEEVSAWMSADGGTVLSAADGLTKKIIHEVREFVIPQGTQISTIGNA
jgi:ATP-dependent Clp protease, protease subunit